MLKKQRKTDNQIKRLTKTKAKITTRKFMGSQMFYYLKNNVHVSRYSPLMIEGSNMHGIIETGVLTVPLYQCDEEIDLESLKSRMPTNEYNFLVVIFSQISTGDDYRKFKILSIQHFKWNNICEIDLFEDSEEEKKVFMDMCNNFLKDIADKYQNSHIQ